MHCSIKQPVALLLGVLALIGCATATAVAEERPPNIVPIISDDQAWSDYGFMGHPIIQTPNLDDWAQRSIVFDRGCVASLLCRLSWASMATGVYPHQHGITDNDMDGNNRGTLEIPICEQYQYTRKDCATP